MRSDTSAVVIRLSAALVLAGTGTLIGGRAPLQFNETGLVWLHGGLRQAEYWDAVESPFGVAIGVFYVVVWVLALAGVLLVTFLTRTRSGALRSIGILLACASIIVVASQAVYWMHLSPQQYDDIEPL